MEQVIAFVGGLAIYMFLCYVIARHAQTCLHSFSAWFGLSFIFTPLVAFVFLCFAGTPHEAVVLKEKEDRARQEHPSRTDLRAIAIAETQCPKCGARVNPETRDGLRSPEDQPWQLLCLECGAEVEPNT